MPTTIELSYTKKLGLPAYSSHGCQASIRTDAESVAHALEQLPLLYKMLQASVDTELQSVGFVPDVKRYGFPNAAPAPSKTEVASAWACTKEQKVMIVTLAKRHGIGQKALNALSLERFKESVAILDARQAARLIQELATQGESAPEK